jgi:hypothetical protein
MTQKSTWALLPSITVRVQARTYNSISYRPCRYRNSYVPLSRYRTGRGGDRSYSRVPDEGLSKLLPR